MSGRARQLALLVDRAMRGADALPAADLADLNEAAAVVLARYVPSEAERARRKAGLLRQALACQLDFTALLRG